jgi:serine/threonine protein kinase
MADLTGTRLGDFAIVRELGRGGMGVVYEARQVSLNRKVALKVLSGGLGLTSKAVQRFRREAEAAAKLHHTNIVPVYATDEQDGTHFYAMELIDGPSLDHVIRRLRLESHTVIAPGGSIRGSDFSTGPADPSPPTPLDVTGPYVASADPPEQPPQPLSSSSLGSGGAYFDTVARLVAEVADALDYARKEGVIHRDIKPSNLLLSPAGRLSVNDFGLARVLEQPGVTLTGEFVGTPAYMSPEQVTAGRVPLDHRTDIYSLGATLYELLTLRPPFCGPQRDQLLAQIVQKEPTPPRKVNKRVPADLETICLKAMEKDPDRRYQTAGALAEDLRRYVDRFAITARRAGPLARLRKWANRNPVVAAAGVVVLLAVAAAAFFAWRAEAERRQRLADERQRSEAVTAERRKTAIERGMAAALAADLPAAESAVAEAELLGASTGETRLLRGFIALYSGRVADAVDHLEQAVRLMPQSVSARSLLAKANADALNWPAARRRLEEAAALTPQTAEDKLFLGQALGTLRPADGLPLMDQALAERPSGIGHVLRANVRGMAAAVSGSVADAEAAVVDAELAKRLLPGNPYSLSVAAYSQLAAAVAYRRAGRPDKWGEHLTAAGHETDALARFPEHYGAVATRHVVAMVRDGLNGRLDMVAELEQTRATAPMPALAFHQSYDLFCLGRDVKARELADRFPDDRLTGHIRFLLALGRRDGRAEARRAWDEMAGPDRLPDFRLEATPLLFTVGNADEVATVARDLGARRDRLRYSTYTSADVDDVLAFLEGTASEADFLGRPASNEYERFRRHYAIGWKRLGGGDRRGARAAFQEAYDAMSFGLLSWCVARATLIRMKDPDWPQAIPTKN